MHRNAPLPLEGRRGLVEKCQPRAMRTSQTAHSSIGFPGTLRNPLEPRTVGYKLPPSGVALSSAIMSTRAPNGTCATLTALRAWMPRSPTTWTSSSDAPSATRCGSVKFGAPLTMTNSFATRTVEFGHRTERRAQTPAHIRPPLGLHRVGQALSIARQWSTCVIPFRAFAKETRSRSISWVE